ncbi:MAG TPA: hypothetical protein VKA08_14985, partial [Balneolales bacterium]|nr:hypothetical protein [Balneolales bacterium]
LITAIACFATVLQAQKSISPVRFTISGSQYGKGKTYIYPADYEMFYQAQLRDGNTTDIDANAQFPADNPTEQVSLSIKLFCGPGPTVQSLYTNIDQNGHPPGPSPGQLIITILGPGGGSYQSYDGTVTIEAYGDVSNYVTGHFTASLAKADENGNIIKGYYAKDNFKVKRIQ